MGVGGVGPCGSMNQVGYRSVILVNQRLSGQNSPQRVFTQFIITIGTRKKTNLNYFGKAHMCFICKYIITTNLHSQITRKAGRDTSKLLKAKHINPRGMKTATKVCL